MAFDLGSLKSALGSVSKPSNQLHTFDLRGIADLIKDGKVKKIITMVGAGISTAAGIPDFRSPSTGVYDNLEEYHLPDPMAVFSIDYFRKDPRPFFEVARRLYKPDAKPTFSHYFIKLLQDKELLLRHYTQNVDSLERLAGVNEDKLIEAHGSFHTGHCIECHHSYSFEFLESHIMNKKMPKCTKCDSVVKPDVVFFGENLPKRFFNNVSRDFSDCDLLIIMGTSLTVMPFCGLIHRVGSEIPRLYINREYMGGSTGSSDMRWGKEDNKRDVFVAANTDDAVLELCSLLGWKDDLMALKKENDLLLCKSASDKKDQKS